MQKVIFNFPKQLNYLCAKMIMYNLMFNPVSSKVVVLIHCSAVLRINKIVHGAYHVHISELLQVLHNMQKKRCLAVTALSLCTQLVYITALTE